MKGLGLAVAAGTRHQLEATVLLELAPLPDQPSSLHLGMAGVILPSGRNKNILWRLEGIWVTDGCVDLLQS